MFDIGFSELIVIAVVALVVIGPERLPTVARTIGALLGRLNRYVADVKSDVEREMRLEDMKKLRAEVEQQAMGFEQSVVKELEATRAAVEQPVTEAQQSLAEVMQETGQTAVEIQQGFELPANASSAEVLAAELAQADSLRAQQQAADAAAADALSAALPPTPARATPPQATLDFAAANETTSATAPSSEVKPAAKA